MITHLLLLVTLASSQAYADQLETSNQRKRGILSDGWVGLSNPYGGYGLGQPWAAEVNPWKGLKVSAGAADLPFDTSSGWQYGSAKPIIGLPIKHETHHVKTVPVVVTKHVVVEKPVAVRVPEPVLVDRPIHVPIEKVIPVPIEKIVHKPVPIAVPYPQAIPVPIEHAVPIPVKHPVAVPVHQPYPVPIKQPVPYPVAVPVPFPVHHGHHQQHHYPPGVFFGHGHGHAHGHGWHYPPLPYHGYGYYPHEAYNHYHSGPEHHHSQRSVAADYGKTKRSKSSNAEYNADANGKEDERK